MVLDGKKMKKTTFFYGNHCRLAADMQTSVRLLLLPRDTTNFIILPMPACVCNFCSLQVKLLVPGFN